MDFFTALVYGVIQSLTEFLPVSSSGHLALLPYYLNISDPGVFFDLSMHLGTALSIVVYYRREVRLILRESWGIIIRRKGNSNDRCFTLNLWIATLASLALIFAIKPFSESIGRWPETIAFNLILFGVALFVGDWFFSQDAGKKFNRADWKAAVIVGLAQALAIFPGVSRIGITITAARVLNFGRAEGSRFSFLLSLPIILAGFFYKLLKEDFVSNGWASFPWLPCLVGAVASFLVGLLAIHFFIKLIAKMGLWVFTIYRIILGTLILWIF